MSTISPPTESTPGHGWFELLQVRELWASLAISAMWIAVACLLALVLLWLNRLLLTRVPAGARRRAVRVLVPASGLIGGVLPHEASLGPPWLDTCWEPSSWRELYERRSNPRWLQRCWCIGDQPRQRSAAITQPARLGISGWLQGLACAAIS